MTTPITGATGFLGSRLLLGLLVRRGRHVTVLGRGTAAELRSRVLAVLESLARGGIGAPARSRLRCVGGDVTRPWLGLAPAVYGRLAREAETVWHCAGEIALAGERQRRFRTDVHGTERVLEFAGATAPGCRLVHPSTVAVAGGRRAGVVAEEDLTDAFGFETHYDESEYRAERLVRDWARRLGRPAVVLRSGIVASDAAHREGWPGHPLRVLGDMIGAVARNGAPGIPRGHAQPQSRPLPAQRRHRGRGVQHRPGRLRHGGLRPTISRIGVPPGCTMWHVRTPPQSPAASWPMAGSVAGPADRLYRALKG
ncbi:NAD-dependent epimerase/dehydratase family protein [Streptomyces sp. PRKS01-65]|nr:NAD-dependent epimerase/dehydratase family protein [Streptomyces harenosi]